MSILFDLQKADGLTPAEQAVADCLLASLDRLGEMSIADLARESATSNATILRLCRKLGSKGYRDFRVALLREVDRQPSQVRAIDVSAPVYNHMSPVSVMKSIAELKHYAVETVYTGVPTLEVQAAARTIRKARTIFLYAMGESGLVAEVFARRMMRIGYLSVQVERYREGLALAQAATPDDVAVIISYSGQILRRHAAELDVLRKRRVPTVMITSLTEVRGIDIVVRYPHAESEEDNMATFYSTTASSYLLDAIYGIIYAADFEVAHKHKSDTDYRMRHHGRRSVGGKAHK